MRLEFLGNADAGIGDCDFCDTPAVRFTRLLAEGTGDRPALGGIFDRIAQNIQYNFGQIRRVKVEIWLRNDLGHMKMLLFFFQGSLDHDDTGIKIFLSLDGGFFNVYLVILNL